MTPPELDTVGTIRVDYDDGISQLAIVRVDQESVVISTHHGPGDATEVILLGHDNAVTLAEIILHAASHVDGVA